MNKISWRVVIPLFANTRRGRLKRTDFTIISNNCWGGRIYEYFNLPKQTPTVGMYFFAEDYVRFCSNLDYYLSLPLVFINWDESVHKLSLQKKNEEGVIVGKLGDVELVFLHYNDKEVIMQKWKRRIDRINRKNIILKFSYQNECNDELVKQFFKIKGYKKIFFSGEPLPGCEEIVVYPRHDGKETIDETENIDRYMNLVELINSRL